MKKFFAAALVVSMLTVLLSSCMCQVADTTFQFDGSGTVEAKFGFSEEMVNAMNMRAEMTQNGFSYFRYNGHSYYGDQASESFANADEFNAIFAEVSAEISEVSKAATPGKVTLSVADDGGLTLTVQNDQNDRRAAIKKALAAELPDYSDAQIDALPGSNGGETNYVRLRDIASLLNGTNAQFGVDWDGNVIIVPDEAYKPNGTEMQAPFSGDRRYQKADAKTVIYGESIPFTAILLTDDQGGGYTYYKLRDLGKVLNFNVGWSNSRGIYIESNHPYEG